MNDELAGDIPFIFSNTVNPIQFKIYKEENINKRINQQFALKQRLEKDGGKAQLAEELAANKNITFTSFQNYYQTLHNRLRKKNERKSNELQLGFINTTPCNKYHLALWCRQQENNPISYRIFPVSEKSTTVLYIRYLLYQNVNIALG